MAKNILLILGGYKQSMVGEQFLDSMLKSYPKSKIWRYSIVNTEIQSQSERDKVAMAESSPWPGITSLLYLKFRMKSLDNNILEIEQIINANKIEVLWIVLNNAYIIELAHALSTRYSIPIVSHIWDSPEYLLMKQRLDYYSKSRILRNFYRVISNSSYGVVISNNLKEKYKQLYKLDSKVLYFNTPLKSFPKPKLGSNKKIINIVFAGTLYAYKTWKVFLDAIEEFNSTQNDIKISVNCIGNLSRWYKKREWIKYEALRPIEEAIEIVNKADIAYLPYWMSKKYSLAVQTAFPSKLAFYVSAATPVFYHGPLKSTPTDFLRDNKVGIACNSKSHKEIIDSIFYLISDRFLNEYVNSQKITFNKYFHPEVNSEKFISIVKNL